MKKGFIVIEVLNGNVFLHYAENHKSALEFMTTTSAECKTNGGKLSNYDEESGIAWGENDYGLPWSIEIQAMEDIDII